MSRLRVKVAAIALAVEAIVLLLGGIVSGRWLWIIVLTALVTFVIVDWLLVHRRSRAEPDANERLKVAFAGLALGMAFPALNQVWAWLSALVGH